MSAHTPPKPGTSSGVQRTNQQALPKAISNPLLIPRDAPVLEVLLHKNERFEIHNIRNGQQCAFPGHGLFDVKYRVLLFCPDNCPCKVVPTVTGEILVIYYALICGGRWKVLCEKIKMRKEKIPYKHLTQGLCICWECPIIEVMKEGELMTAVRDVNVMESAWNEKAKP
ncbi:hypothetical protein K440DRAFT_624985 [Wilcoxina mikolae CBS 423.85]|nr:hypothetical protein K440DRAFT_624985 [Wilcoxina mikolae CBS 423.85]